MGRSERRNLERRDRIESRKGKLLVSKGDLNRMKTEYLNDVTKNNVEALMTCFALAEHRIHGFGEKRIMRTLQYIDEMMGDIINDRTNIDELKKELEEEAGIIVVND